MQEAWQAKYISSLKNFMTNDFYSTMDGRLNDFRKHGKTDHTENIPIIDIVLKGWRQEYDLDIIKLGLVSPRG